jgi:hypothetical protein
MPLELSIMALPPIDKPAPTPTVSGQMRKKFLMLVRGTRNSVKIWYSTLTFTITFYARQIVTISYLLIF